MIGFHPLLFSTSFKFVLVLHPVREIPCPLAEGTLVAHIPFFLVRLPVLHYLFTFSLKYLSSVC